MKIFWVFCILIVLIIPIRSVFANPFVNSAKTASLAVSGAGTTCGTILAAVNYARTILFAQMTTSTAGDTNSIIIDGIYAYQSQKQNLWWSYAPYQIPANIPVTCERSSGANVIYKIVYVNYDVTQYPETNNDQTQIYIFYAIMLVAFFILIFIFIMLPK